MVSVVNSPHREDTLGPPLHDVVGPCPRAHIEPRHSEEHVHLFVPVDTVVGHDRYGRICAIGVGDGQSGTGAVGISEGWGC